LFPREFILLVLQAAQRLMDAAERLRDLRELGLRGGDRGVHRVRYDLRDLLRRPRGRNFGAGDLFLEGTGHGGEGDAK
jgi:hypothetical protein